MGVHYLNTDAKKIVNSSKFCGQMFGATKNYFYLCQRLDEVESIRATIIECSGLTPISDKDYRLPLSTFGKAVFFFLYLNKILHRGDESNELICPMSHKADNLKNGLRSVRHPPGNSVAKRNCCFRGRCGFGRKSYRG